ncbi:sulfur oxidation c-type cytochrome SoxX [Rhizobacter sp. Root404]|uniref:sulfur oxidation c-type cytochrome SoxX n=1 Tax=Rhizobacter sp. Root404 TaxID=1736528 RepID=UPI0006F9FA9B|nr:sulfur oxidation c-type cytochrome SoxX [Rhizobacter sp. Root404]KQW36468.1 sulfur oxidation c-type cytochrome SoxX [Rhizobacter sp. Root404]
MTIKYRVVTAFAAAAVVIAAGCASTPAPVDYDQLALSMIKSSFRDQGQAKLDRLDQDAVQKACSGPTPPAPEVARKLEAEALAGVKPPAAGRYLGDWKEGEKLAQNGRGMTWSDPAGSANGGNCYNCHQMAKAEISYGTLGPSLYHYGKLRGVKDPADPVSAPIVQYTWGKLYNAKAYNACSGMPRFGHEKLLSEKQMQDVMALLLDPKSPVNQ